MGVPAARLNPKRVRACGYHDAEVSALVAGFCGEQGREVQQLLQQLGGFGQMFPLVAELALAAHTQQSVHLALVTCREMGGGGCPVLRRANATDCNREGGGGLTQLEQDLPPSRAHFSLGVAESVYVIVELLPLLQQARQIIERLTQCRKIYHIFG